MTQFVILDDLVKLMVRSFYPDEYIVVVDAILKEKRRVKDVEIAEDLSLPTKFCRKVMTGLRTDSILKSQEKKIEGTKPNEKSTIVVLWYFDYKHIINVIKYKLYMIRKRMEAEKVSKIDKQQYKCLKCSKRFTAFDVAKISMMGELICDSCSGGLVEEKADGSFTDQTKHHADLVGQLKRLEDQLKKTKDLTIPLFARDMAEDDSVIGPSYTIKGGGSSNEGRKVGAFDQDKQNKPGGALGGWMDPTTQKVDFFVDIYETDNIDSSTLVSDASKKDIKNIKAVPPWILPKSQTNTTKSGGSSSTMGGGIKSTLNDGKITIKLEGLGGSKVPPKTLNDIQVPPNTQVDPNYLSEYLKQHYKDEKDIVDTTKKSPTTTSTSTTASTDETQRSGSSSPTHKKQKIDNETSADSIFVSFGNATKPISQITDDDQEVMTSQEYDDYSHTLYDYVASLNQ